MTPRFPRWLPGAAGAAPDRRALAAAALLGAVLLAASVAGEGILASLLRGSAVVIALGLALALVRRRSPGPGATSAVAVLERRALAKDAGVALVEVEGERLLVGYAPGAISLVARVPRPGDAP